MEWFYCPLLLKLGLDWYFFKKRNVLRLLKWFSPTRHIFLMILFQRVIVRNIDGRGVY